MGPRTHQVLWSECVAGREPAELLSATDRERLVLFLAGQGWSDAQIATHTRMTTYTTARVRLRAAERARDESAARWVAEHAAA